MSSSPADDEHLKAIFDRFQIPDGCAYASSEPYGGGHINDTFRVRTVATDGAAARDYILQRINRAVFPRPAEVMENVARVTRHVAAKVRARGGDPSREVLTLLPARDGRDYVISDEDYWRVYLFVNDTITVSIGDDWSPSGPAALHPVREAAAAFARFQRDVADL